MYFVTSDEIREIDRVSISEYKIPSEILMYTAAKEISDFIIGNFNADKTITICCGSGNNGGDGFAAGFILKNLGYNVKIHFYGNLPNISKDSKLYYNLCLQSKLIITKKFSYTSDIILDCLIGTGFIPPINDKYKNIIKNINDSKAVRISVDIPSGLPADGPVEIDSNCIKSDYTITIGMLKHNLVTYPGTLFCGKVILKRNIFPEELLKKYNAFKLINSDYIKQNFNSKKDTYTNKYNEGAIIVIAGSVNMSGAAILSTRSLFETGCGIAKLFTDELTKNQIVVELPETITFNRNDIINDPDRLSSDKRYNSILIGPGFGRTPDSKNIFKLFLQNMKGFRKAIIDGDGLYFLKKHYIKGAFKNCAVIITPHEGEASNLLGIDTIKVKQNRINSAIKLSNLYDSTVILKGHETIITNGIKTLVINSGNEALATAGTGDVLSGILASVFLKHDNPLDASAIAVYIHGQSCIYATKKEKINTIKASDIIHNIKNVIGELIN